MQMTEVGNKLYEVASETDANITYIVNTGATVPTCTCTAFAIKRNRIKGDTGRSDGGWCKHLEAVKSEFEVQSRAAEEAEALDTEAAVAGIRLKHLLEELEP